MTLKEFLFILITTVQTFVPRSCIITARPDRPSRTVSFSLFRRFIMLESYPRKESTIKVERFFMFSSLRRATGRIEKSEGKDFVFYRPRVLRGFTHRPSPRTLMLSSRESRTNFLFTTTVTTIDRYTHQQPARCVCTFGRLFGALLVLRTG